MARLSAEQAYDESEDEVDVEEESVSADGVADSEEEEGAMEEQATPKRRRLNADARHSNGNASRSSRQGAMGQEESRETVKWRNTALHRAGQEARQPPKGKLKRLSGGPSRAPSARIPLANGNTYDLSDDNEEDVLQNNVRRTPIRRTAKPTQNASYKSLAEVQADINLQIQMEQDEVGSESEGHEQEEPVVEQPQQSSGGKKRRGRPPKSPKDNDENRRTRGWLLAQSHPDNRRREQSKQPSTSAIQSPEANAASADPVTPDTTAAPKRRVGRPTKEEAAAARAAQANRRSSRVSGENIEPTTEPAEQAASTSKVRQLRNGAGQATTSNIGKRVRPRVNNQNNDQEQAAEAINSVAQPVVIDDEQSDDRAHGTNEEAEEAEGGGEDHGPQGNDDSEYEEDEDEDEEEEEPSNTDPQRLHGQWGAMGGILHEARNHTDETPNIRDNTFNAALRACKNAITKVRATASGISPDELVQITTECRDSVSRAEALCCDTSNVRNRDDRGYHIFKFLMPALARLLKAVIEALERVDIEGAGLPQISMAHLPIVLNLIHAIYNCGNQAYHAYTRLDPDRPVKTDVHARITIPLRDLHATLKDIYQRRAAFEAARVQANAIAAEEAARNEERERLEEWRGIVMRNQGKWKKMDTVRRDLVFNTGNKKLWHHIHDCPSTRVVETRDDGQPFLPAELREEVTPFTMRELVALEEGLIKHVDRPSTLKSEVFENLMMEYCRYGGELSERNTLEIVRAASDLKHWRIYNYRKSGTDIPQWVKQIPAWMEPLEYE